MSVLLDSLAGAFDGDAARRRLLDAALRDGLPGPRAEAWKYTSLRALERRTFAASSSTRAVPVDPAIVADMPSPRIVYVNGRLEMSLSSFGDLQAGLALDDEESWHPDHLRDARSTDPVATADDVFVRLNTALANHGATLSLQADVQTTAPIHIVCIGAPADTDLAWHLRHRIALSSGASATVVEHHLGTGAHRHFDNSTMRIDLSPGATLTHVRLQAADDGATCLLRTDACVEHDARYVRVDLELGAALSRHELNVRLAGDRAALTANGVLLAAGRRHVDTRLGIEHVACETSCDLVWRGIGAGRGRAVFHGGITIDAGADGSDASLLNKNLLLGHDAEIDTQPVLVINADEVKAAHGATVGQLDPTAMFYLRSRGLPEDAARALLTSAFVREPLSAIDDAALRERLQVRLERALRNATA